MKRKYLTAEALASQLASLSELCQDDLRARWTELYGTIPPQRLNRNLLIGAVAYRMQEQALGGLKPQTERLLQKIAAEARAGVKVEIKQSRNLAGTVLLREWQGVTHQVEVLEQGVRYLDKHYRSLSEVARVITGSHWSGPLFFGLRKRHD